MDYFAGLDISGDETYVCVLERRRRGGSLQQDGVDGRGDRRRIGIDLRPVASMAAICAFETFSGRQDRRGERRSWAESTREGSLGAACDQLDEGRDTFSSARRSREAKIGLPTNSTGS
jgi:hypothetical protein